MYINFMNQDKKNIYISTWLLLITLLIGLIIAVGGLTRLTDSGLSITRWELFSGLLPPLSNDDWLVYFKGYKDDEAALAISEIIQKESDFDSL